MGRKYNFIQTGCFSKEAMIVFKLLTTSLFKGYGESPLQDRYVLIGSDLKSLNEIVVEARQFMLGMYVNDVIRAVDDEILLSYHTYYDYTGSMSCHEFSQKVVNDCLAQIKKLIKILQNLKLEEDTKFYLCPYLINNFDDYLKSPFAAKSIYFSQNRHKVIKYEWLSIKRLKDVCLEVEGLGQQYRVSNPFFIEVRKNCIKKLFIDLEEFKNDLRLSLKPYVKYDNFHPDRYETIKKIIEIFPLRFGSSDESSYKALLNEDWNAFVTSFKEKCIKNRNNFLIGSFQNICSTIDEVCSKPVLQELKDIIHIVLNDEVFKNFTLRELLECECYDTEEYFEV